MKPRSELRASPENKSSTKQPLVNDFEATFTDVVTVSAISLLMKCSSNCGGITLVIFFSPLAVSEMPY